MLSGKELFKHRFPQDKSVPQRGGAKDFSPDGSWLQEKWLKKVREERKQVLSEQRVERHGGLVKGEWNPDVQLVQLEKEMGKFWIHMGFVDLSRKWLHPEEALFLMETNTLMVYYKGLPISIQQAYATFLSNSAMTTDYYLVYAHLRRLGYVVLRHQGRLSSTKYERKIHLDQHSQSNAKQKRKMDHNAKGIDADGKMIIVDHKKIKIDNGADEIAKCDITGGVTSRPKDDLVMETNILTENARKDTGSDPVMDNILQSLQTETDKQPPSTHINTCDGKLEMNKQWTVDYSVWNYEEIYLPDMGSCQEDMLQLFRPKPYLLPDGVYPHNFVFDVKSYWRKTAELNAKKKKKDFHRKDKYFNEDLEFSYIEMFKKRKNINARNWQEYKAKVSEREDSQKQWPLDSPAECLWRGEITPLIKPGDATSTAAILQKLQIIQNANCFQDKRGNKHGLDDEQQIIFDVYLPDSKFKKSKPGVPNYRVSIVTSSKDPPNLSGMVSIHRSCWDDVPVIWAVVDGGNISFFQFSDISLPVEVSMG